MRKFDNYYHRHWRTTPTRWAKSCPKYLWSTCYEGFASKLHRNFPLGTALPSCMLILLRLRGSWPSRVAGWNILVLVLSKGGKSYSQNFKPYCLISWTVLVDVQHSVPISMTVHHHGLIIHMEHYQCSECRAGVQLLSKQGQMVILLRTNTMPVFVAPKRRHLCQLGWTRPRQINLQVGEGKQLASRQLILPTWIFLGGISPSLAILEGRPNEKIQRKKKQAKASLTSLFSKLKFGDYKPEFVD